MDAAGRDEMAGADELGRRRLIWRCMASEGLSNL